MSFVFSLMVVAVDVVVEVVHAIVEFL